MATVLLVEDDPRQQLLYDDELTGAGYQVMVAGDGRSAIEMAEEARPDVVILDVRLPDVGGMEVLQRLLAKDRGQKVIINTAYASYRDNFMSWAADAYLVKSSNLDRLKSTVSAVIAAGNREHLGQCVDCCDPEGLSAGGTDPSGPGLWRRSVR